MKSKNLSQIFFRIVEFEFQNYSSFERNYYEQKNPVINEKYIILVIDLKIYIYFN